MVVSKSMIISPHPTVKIELIDHPKQLFLCLYVIRQAKRNSAKNFYLWLWMNEGLANSLPEKVTRQKKNPKISVL